MINERIELFRLCGLAERPTSGTLWHDAITVGFPVQALAVTAEAIGVHPDELAGLLGVAAPVEGHAPAKLSRDASNFLYRIALALTRFLAKNGGDVEKAANWLRTVEPTIKGYIPILLLQSHIGAEYVFAYIDRLESPKDRLVAQNEAPDVGTTEFTHQFAEDIPAEDDPEEEEEEEEDATALDVNPFVHL